LRDFIVEKSVKAWCRGFEGNSTDIPVCPKHFTAQFSSTGKTLTM